MDPLQTPARTRRILCTEPLAIFDSFTMWCFQSSSGRNWMFWVTPVHRLTCVAAWNWTTPCWFVWPKENWLSLVSSNVFFLAILWTWLHRHYWMKTELSCMTTFLNLQWTHFKFNWTDCLLFSSFLSCFTAEFNFVCFIVLLLAFPV